MSQRIASVAAFVIGSACGRVGFDATGARSDASSNDASAGDGTMDDASVMGDAATDALVSACAAAMAVPLATRVALTTCGDGQDRLDGCGPAGTQEVIVKFVAPSARGYNVRAYDPGTQNVSNSVGVIDATCATVSPCAGIYGASLAAGEVIYFAVEAASGGCASVELEIQ